MTFKATAAALTELEDSSDSVAPVTPLWWIAAFCSSEKDKEMSNVYWQLNGLKDLLEEKSEFVLSIIELVNMWDRYGCKTCIGLNMNRPHQLRLN